MSTAQFPHKRIVGAAAQSMEAALVICLSLSQQRVSESMKTIRVLRKRVKTHRLRQQRRRKLIIALISHMLLTACTPAPRRTWIKER